MISGISIPVLTPFKFYPASSETGDGVNFQNIDNTALPLQDWEGVYHSRFVQPVTRFWNDFSPGIDFQIITDGAQTYGDTTVTFEDLDSNVLFTLESENFFVKGTDVIGRFYADKFIGINDGCYKLVIRVQDNPVYNSEVFSLSDIHEDCYPLEYSNFENDFGLIFTNASAATWVGKMMFPLRMFKPTTEEEKEVYENDVNELTTLRSIPKRMYEVESFPVPTWFAEKVKMIFGCSDLQLNKLAVNTESGINIEVLSESDKMQITGNVQLNGFTDEYAQNDALDTVTELLTSWQDDGATEGDWTQFTNDGNEITLGLYEDVGIAEAFSNNFNIVTDQKYLIDITPTNEIEDMEITLNSQTFDIELGRNVILFTSTASESDKIILNVKACDFQALTSMKKII